MEQFVQQHLKDVQRNPGEPPKNESKALTVEKVAKVSIAAKAGIQPGDLLTHVDGRVAVAVEFEGFLDPKELHQYRFFSPKSGQEISFKASGAPIGVATEKTTSELERQIKKDAIKDGPILTSMWKRGDWDALLRCAKKSQRGGLLARLLGPTRNTPATLLIGAALYELENQSEGLELIQEYMSNYEKDWTTQYHAIARYYLALASLEEGDRDSAIDLLRKAIKFSPLDRIVGQLEALTGERPQENDRWGDERFPDYTLPTIKGDREGSFQQTADSLQPGQILLVCLLASYRANGPYHDFMKRYHQVATHLQGRIRGIHVITTEREESDYAKHWMRGEEVVRNAGLACEVLYDGDGAITRLIRPTKSPMKFAVAASGAILQEGSILDDVEIWEILDKAERSP